MVNGMEQAIAIFNDHFAPWSITLPAGTADSHETTWRIELPEEAIANRRAGRIVWMSGESWTIRFRFGQDENGEYLQFYATHHMTNDRHLKIYADGSALALSSVVNAARFSSEIAALGFNDQNLYDIPPQPFQREVRSAPPGLRIGGRLRIRPG